MKQTVNFDLELALKHYLNSLKSNDTISKTDHHDLLNHLYSEIEILEKSGLSTEESFLISKKRLGYTKRINPKPREADGWKSVIQFIVPALLLFTAFSFVLNVIRIISNSTALIINEYGIGYMDSYIGWGDWLVQVLGLTILLGIGFFWIKNMRIIKLKNFWPMPLFFLISEIAVRSSYYGFKGLGEHSIIMIDMHNSLLSIAIVGLGIILSIVMVLRNKNLKLQFG